MGVLSRSLLRTLGIPARYEVGYATQEYSALEGQYIARSRHAHSWALGFINGRWVRIDTTPTVWASEGEEQASAFQPVTDLFSWISFTISRLRSSDDPDEESNAYNLLWLLMPLVIILFWRLYFKERIQRTRATHEVRVKRLSQGQDSVFYQVLDLLERTGYKRRRNETVLHWITRINHLVPGNKLLLAASLHYQYRFDPAGLQPHTKQKLSNLVSELLSDIGRHINKNDGLGKRTI